MPVIYAPDHPVSIELEKWNKPYVFRPFPKMLYQARRRPDGIVSVGEADDHIFGGHPGSAEQWSRGCQRIVKDEDEFLKAKGLGWRETPGEAREAFEREETRISDAAAHRAYEDRNLSEPAKAEAAAVEAESVEHKPEIPEKRRRGRPRKAEA